MARANGRRGARALRAALRGARARRLELRRLLRPRSTARCAARRARRDGTARARRPASRTPTSPARRGSPRSSRHWWRRARTPRRSAQPAAERPSLAGAAGPPILQPLEPVGATLVRNELLSGAGSQKEVRAVAFDLSDTGARYEAGDSLGVVCANAPGVVAEWLDATGIAPHTIVELDGAGALRSWTPSATRLDITKITARPGEVHRGAQPRPHPVGAAAAREQGAPRAVPVEPAGGRPRARLPGDGRPPTTGSGCSSGCSRGSTRSRRVRRATPTPSQLTVSVVRFETESGRARGGVCSTFLADGDAAIGPRVPAAIARTSGRPRPATRR